MIKRTHHSRTDATIQLAEIDTGVRQCLQLLWACQAVKEQGAEVAKDYWMKLAERAWRDFDEDRQFAQRGRDGVNGTNIL